MIVLFGKQTYFLTVPCTIAPTNEREISAPFEGTIAEVLVKPGANVEKGQVLVKMDCRQLHLELQQAISDKASAEMEAIQGVSQGDPKKAAIARAKSESAAMLVRKIQHRMEASEIRAPSKGVILSGDLDKRIGEAVPIGAPLMVFAPLDQWKVVLEAPEFATSLIQPGQPGTFSAHAKPESQSNFK